MDGAGLSHGLGGGLGHGLRRLAAWGHHVSPRSRHPHHPKYPVGRQRRSGSSRRSPFPIAAVVAAVHRPRRVMRRMASTAKARMIRRMTTQGKN